MVIIRQAFLLWPGASYGGASRAYFKVHLDRLRAHRICPGRILRTARQWIARAARQGSTAAMDEMRIVTARANGDIRRAEQLRAQQSTGNNSGTCRPGFFGGHGMPCRSFSLMV